MPSTIQLVSAELDPVQKAEPTEKDPSPSLLAIGPGQPEQNG